MDIAIIGAGPAGLSAGYELSRTDHQVTVLEQDPQFVGGISRTVECQGYRFDIGGHRFFTKNPEIEAFWHRLLGEDLLRCRRLSRIFYGGKFYDYPLRAGNAFANLGLANTTKCVLDYVKSQVFPRSPEESFEDWVTNHFGSRLFDMFFKTYTEKVWGMRCSEISADWAAQRIQGLSLASAIRSALWPRGSSQNPTMKTLTRTFWYPKWGPGMLWERVAAHIREQGGVLKMGAKVSRLAFQPRLGITGIITSSQEFLAPDQVISSMPIRSLIRAMTPTVPKAVQIAADSLKYRDFITVALMIDAPDMFPDQWIYIHDPGVKVGRIQNFKNWSPAMVPDPSTSCLGMEYFCFEGDGLWTSSDAELLALAEREARSIGLLGQSACIGGTVVRVPKAYPVYDQGYATHLATIRQYLVEYVPNLHLIGRNGMHRYNNQDHAMLTGFLAAQNILGSHYDLWAVNGDAEYLETSTTRQVPGRISLSP